MKSGNKKTRPLSIEEYKKIMELCLTGFKYESNGKEKTFRPNKQLYIALALEANLGLRISDIKRLTLNNFKDGRLYIDEKKTKKIQDRKVNPELLNIIKDYVIEKGLKPDEKIISILDRTIQHHLSIISDYLELTDVSTHSFRKLYANLQYERNGHDIDLVKELLNHSSIATTQRYIKVSQAAIDKASEDFFI